MPAPADRSDLAAERRRLIEEAERRRYRLHRLIRLTGRLKAVTTELLKEELTPAEPIRRLGPDEDERPDQRNWWDD